MAAQKIICDTDVIIDYWKVNNKRHSQTKTIFENEIELANVVITAITKMEVLIGAISKNDLNEMNKKFHRLRITNITEEITLKAFELIEKYTLSHGLALPD